MGTLDWFVVAISVATLALFMLARVRNNVFWRATVTPLASIIGSGFLVVAPLLGSVAGSWSVVAMAGIVLVAYAIGGVLRFNILKIGRASCRERVSYPV